ncbi:IclR family transcriptional regulator [Geomicrobium sp. JCM 19039]|uniref:IclR family transcriptional regulator n=1 Tax=Geomicrobium sp. JCM 19039 TaxID=1460636 RepID=UPI00045F45D9|nr:IclR family transcriptional regulator [Geomicrobium sp. JCM 19039]GAK12160.1 transcriptional regulator, IclR family [Geomicrobium sp. JCM 19039]
MTSKTVHKSLTVLEKFTVEQPAWGLRELARELDMNHTVVHRFLSTFEDRGYLTKNEDSGKYEVGFKLLELSHVAQEKFKLSEQIQSTMQKLAMETGESSVFTLRDHDYGVFINIAEGSNIVRFADSIGRRSPLYLGATHKSILSYLPEDAIARVGERAVEEKFIQSPNQLHEALKVIREQGYAYSASETFEDVAAMAVPIFDRDARVIGSLGIAGPPYRISEEYAMKNAHILFRYQKEIQPIIKMSPSELSELYVN